MFGQKNTTVKPIVKQGYFVFGDGDLVRGNITIYANGICVGKSDVRMVELTSAEGKDEKTAIRFNCKPNNIYKEFIVTE